MEKPIRYMDIHTIRCTCGGYMDIKERACTDLLKCQDCGYELFLIVVVTDNHDQGG